MKQEQYRVALWADEASIDEARSERGGITGGSIAPDEITGVTITSTEPCYGGIRITGGDYQIKDLTVRLDGSGGDDFGGKGTGLVCAGTVKVTVDNYVADNRGVIRNAVVVTDNAEAVFRNADITCRGGTPEELAQAKREVRGLPHVPWVLGLTGCNRARHRVSRITAENNYELGMVDNELCPAVNNGVIAFFDSQSVWTVGKTCYLTALTLESGAVVQAPAGKTLTMTVDGQTVEPLPGIYQGNIIMTIA